MTEHTARQRVFIVEGRPWKDAVIAHLEPRSPYRPWFTGEDIRNGDVLITVLDTDPRTVLCMEVAGSSSLDAAGVTESWTLTALPSVTAFEAHAGVAVPTAAGRVDDAIAGRLTTPFFTNPASFDDMSTRRGEASHTTAAAARVLLKSAGKCTACGQAINLRRSTARDHIHIHTAENDVDHWAHHGPTHDWPAILCDKCQTAMTEGGFSNFLDYRFSFHPSCPLCAASRSSSTSIGMPLSGEPVPP
ncbi:hypothetical protein [Rhodococcus opacus]|uniref:hypothetical protein n=1 Tax=Rhodococcus opacus TaxID=37919 RepID=UPI001CEC7C3E|nr:hypothetical protein [Rhodococcus opacus]